MYTKRTMCEPTSTLMNRPKCHRHTNTHGLDWLAPAMTLSHLLAIPIARNTSPNHPNILAEALCNSQIIIIITNPFKTIFTNIKNGPLTSPKSQASRKICSIKEPFSHRHDKWHWIAGAYAVHFALFPIHLRKFAIILHSDALAMFDICLSLRWLALSPMWTNPLATWMKI